MVMVVGVVVVVGNGGRHMRGLAQAGQDTEGGPVHVENDAKRSLF